MSLFHATADAYGRHRHVLPDEVVHLDRLTAAMEARRSGVAAYIGAWDWATGPEGPLTHAEEATQ
ncbi:hypothetical protein ACN6AT_38380 (plasmid) [Streptomyces sp. JL4002]|uniref:hypothetical protein n=1 Tax=Streptomyces sp. JL4002 TaxID=3404781 RepID=UPI003B27F91E